MVAPKAHSLGHLIMDLQLQDKVVLLTGGAKAIGAAIIKTCAQEGADRHAQASRFRRQENHGRDRIDALVNDAGINDKIALEQGWPWAFLTSLERNLLHYYKMAHSALPHNKSRGSIVTSFGKRRLRTCWSVEVMCSWAAL